MAQAFDAIVIGTGQAGPSLAFRCAQEGLRTLVVERGSVGGTCVNTGCTPTKALVASARVAHMARRAGDFGLTVEGLRVDASAVLGRARSIGAESNRGLEKALAESEGITFVKGHARFRGPGEIEVEGETYRAPRIFVNVGGRARVPDLPGLDQVAPLTNSSLLELDSLPEHLIVVGGSYIGLEFAQIFRRLGSRVSVLQRGERLIPRDDPDVSSAVRDFLEGEGIEVHTRAECIRLSPHAEGVEIGSECKDEDGAPTLHGLVGSHVLLAVGRVPNTADLGLELAGVEVDKRGYIQTDSALATSAEGVWALGDCNGRGAFTHTSYNDFEVVAANLFDGQQRSVEERVSCYGLYTDPPLGRVGMTEAEARQSGRRVLVGKLPMSRVGRAKERGETAGFLKLLVDADSQETLGAAILGIRGDEAVQCILTSMVAGQPYPELASTMLIHPTVSELIPSALQSLKPLDDEPSAL